MTPDELPAMWQAIRERALQGITDAANAMANAYQRRLVTSTLVRYSHPPFTKTPSPPGQPPAIVTGTLRRSVRPVYATGAPGGIARSEVAPHTVYARIQEYGGHIYPVRRQYLRWFSDVPEGGSSSAIAISVGRSVPKGTTIWAHFAKHVELPKRPYMRPTTADMVADGSLTRTAAGAFVRTVG